ncbi:tRNA pseudouridine(55) synthase TruB [Caldibacillus lycopersici]|uniref:tRNA pseudouridine synthase B n=1 Tax=Perspicuibacillus lycopersici TaxID=1325689 RepID=A0AAE3IPM6_9BACI|nr:tRNA pseudouridine(55) synthase TruB [Perspicuibacillus lycopersici]MCU9612061.1 tRNA pseudouridine(55) synthase TruB [Perspicuibacillus lycopersici]
MNGILPLWKPAGFTSHDCVMKVRKLLKTKKVGHTGTLDPSVTGVLPIAIGNATKVVQYIIEAGKSYEGVVTLGKSTTTEDQDGEVVAAKPIEKPITREEILAVLKQLTGEIVQVPPMFSAVKVNGKRLYEYAREGKTVERPERRVTIYELELLDNQESYAGDTVSFPIRVKCSKGTYIRTLAVTIGEMLGYPTHMSKLVRTSAAGIVEEQCITLEDVAEAMERGTIQEKLLPIELTLEQLPKYEIHDTLAVGVKNGSVLPIPDFLENVEQPIAIYYEQKIIAIYKKHPTKTGLMKPDRVLLVN